MAVCAALWMVSAGWAGNSTAPKRFHTTTPHTHHSLKDVGATHSHSSAANVVLPQTEASRQSELGRLEHQNVSVLQARQNSARKNTQATKIRPEPAGHSSGINFSYHPPQTQSAGTSGGYKH